MIKPRLRLILTALALFSVTSVSAQSRAAGAPTADGMAPMRRTQAIFGKIPHGYEELGPAGPYYPARAARLGAQGYAILACHLAGTGSLSRCAVVEEAPADVGFAEAAMKLIERKLLTAAPRSIDGAPLEDEVVEVVVPFQVRRR